jgi:signal transduction histidine kinase/CheY-like chemotaxis protein
MDAVVVRTIERESGAVPLLFRQQLAAYLARYSGDRRVLVARAHALWSSGMRATEILALLEMPTPLDTTLEAALATIADRQSAGTWEHPSSPVGLACLRCAIAMYVRPVTSERYESALIGRIGARAFLALSELLTELRLAQARQRAFGLEGTDEELTRLQTVPLISEEPRFAAFIAEYPRRVRSELEHGEDKIREALRVATEATRRKDEFLAILGHELRNPLAPILTALELMRMHGDDPRTRREREVIERQAKHLRRLVEDLLDVSRITQGKVNLNKEPIEVANAAMVAVEMCSPLFETAHHRLEVEVPPNGLLIEADRVRLAQVFTNLLTNAAKYTPHGGSIRLRASAHAGEAVISVSDDGIGMSPEMLPRVFEPFTQGQRSLDRSQGGLGIGLTLAKSLVELHAGNISAFSAGVGKGSEFVVRLPLLGEGQAEAIFADALRAHSVEINISGEIQAVRLENQTALVRVLLVDDNEDALDLLEQALKARGYDVHAAGDGLRALEMARVVTPDVAVIDIGLPVMDGYEVAGRLRSVCGSSLRMIALTGYGQDSDRERARSAGFDEHLVKPVDIRVLVEAIRSSLGRSSVSG